MILAPTRTAFFFGLTLAANAFSLRAQQATTSTTSVLVPAGSDLRLALDHDSRLHKAGQPVTATLVAPVYAGETMVAPVGTRVEGHVTRIVAGPKGEHVARLLKGDLTPVRVAEVEIDTLILGNGARIPVTTASSTGSDGVRETRYLPKGQKPTKMAQLHEAVNPITQPNKLERLDKTLLNALPYHPNYLNAGAVYDAVLTDELRLAIPAQTLLNAAQVATPSDGLMHLRLVSGLNSGSSEGATTVTAEVIEPFYDNAHRLLYPVGSLLKGRVTHTRRAGWLKKNGALSFNFQSIKRPGGQFVPCTAVMVSLAVAGGLRIAVSSEGDLRGTNSRLEQGFALAGFVLPSLGLADASQIKTAVTRVGAGESGFGLLGAGAAQAAGNVAIGFGYYGAVKGVYGAFLAKGKDMVLPRNTPLSVRVEDTASAPGSAPDPAAVASLQ